MGVSSILRQVGKIEGKEVSFLVDTRATHKFSNPNTADRLGIKSVLYKSFRVTIADGERLTGNVGCSGIKLLIQGHTTVAV